MSKEKTVIEVSSCSLCPASFEAGQYDVYCGWFDVSMEISKTTDFDPNTQVYSNCPAQEMSPLIELRFGGKANE